MNKTHIVLIMASFWTLFSCNNKQQNKNFKLKSKQDARHQIVSQNIYGEKTKFNYSDFNDLKNNKYYDRFLADELIVTTGKIICTDPMYMELGLPQSWIINKGRYPVYLYFGLEEDYNGYIAYSELVIKDEIPAYWEFSLIEENLLADEFERKINGYYPVENGLSCFTDFETYKIYEQEVKDFYNKDKDANFYNDILAPEFSKHKHITLSPRDEEWANFKPANSNGNIILFPSGSGDGLYARYVGYDKNGNVVKFVTDFIKLDKTEMR